VATSSNVVEPPVGLYTAAAKIYPREVSGRFNSLRVSAAFILLGIFYLMPWLNIGDHPAVLFDLPARQFFVFGLIFWPQDFYLLTWLLVIAGFSLFFFTALGGRLWCGYACPQTVWTEVFLALERWAEGRRNVRIKLDAAPWSLHKLRKKTLKQILWVSFALWTGFSFVGYFVPIRIVGSQILAGTIGGWALFWLLFYAFATYGNAGYLREQVCKYMCPYARFQSAMFDQDTLIIGYDHQRGEPRGGRAAGSAQGAKRLGDCVNCTACVQVCPTGIDIRDGLQSDCIACGACADICNQVMAKIGYAPGLIRYATQNELEGKSRRILRPRIVIYAVLLLLLIGGFAAALFHRSPVQAQVLRDRNALYRLVENDVVQNSYTLKLVNKTNLAHDYIVVVNAADDAPIRILQTGLLHVAPLGIAAFSITLEGSRIRGRNEISLQIRDHHNPAINTTVETSFFGPSP
jgi:cytochrome c oxidase accessory protein FixG